MNLKVNYSELARKYGVSRDTIRKYNNGYKGKPKTRKRESKLDKHKEEIEAKLKIVGVNISSVYRYIYEKDKSIGSESNFRKYVKRKNLKVKESKKVHPRYETAPGMQLQYDFKEDIEMISKRGEKFKFNIFAGTLGYSRLSCFEYCKRKTREDVIRSLTNIFVQIRGVPRECLTDNMACIVKKVSLQKSLLNLQKILTFKSENVGYEVQKQKVKLNLKIDL